MTRAGGAKHATAISLVCLASAIGLGGCGSGSPGSVAQSTPAAQATGTAAVSPVVTGSRVGPYRVINVYDGDTAQVARDGESMVVRVIGINTPEVSGPYTTQQCFGPQASAEAKRLLTNRQVWLEADPNQGSTDKYGRTLGFVWIDNDVDFGLHMITDGYAREYTYDKPYPHQSQYQAAQRRAQQLERGLWSPQTCDGQR